MEPVLAVHHFKVAPETQEVVVNEDHLSVEWELRFGQLDDMSLSCELDVWALIPEHEFYREEPETREELTKFAEGEPMLRVMTRVDIQSVTLHMERCGEDPIPLARQRLRAALRIEDTWGERVFWESNMVAMPEHKAVKEPGWRSKVRVDLV